MFSSFTSMLPSGINFTLNKEDKDRDRHDRSPQEATPRPDNGTADTRKSTGTNADEQGVRKKRERNPNEVNLPFYTLLHRYALISSFDAAPHADIHSRQTSSICIKSPSQSPDTACAPSSKRQKCIWYFVRHIQSSIHRLVRRGRRPAHA
jgi:hypothetical protein